MLAYRRDDVRDLNHAAHARMLRRGRLGREAVTLGELEFRVGDRVLCRRNDSRLGVRNGTLGTIVDLGESTLTLRGDDGARRSLPLAYAAEHLDYGYALTGHAAQGATVDRAFVLLLEQGALREWGYVACSRARAETRLYLAGAAGEAETHARQREPANAPGRAARALSRPSNNSLALDQRRDASARLLAQRWQQLERTRTLAAERLTGAECELASLGWRGRRRLGPELRAEIARQQAALRLADETRASLPPPSAHELSRPVREPGPPTRSLHRDLPRERASERRGPELTLEL